MEEALVGWVLTIVLSSTIGAPDKATFRGPRLYQSLNDCRTEGMKAVNWLTQDFMKARWECQTEDGRHLVMEPRGIPAAQK